MKSYGGTDKTIPHTVTFTVKNEVDCQCAKCGKDIMSFDNKWIQVSWEEVLNSYYNYPFVYANGVIIGIIKKEE